MARLLVIAMIMMLALISTAFADNPSSTEALSPAQVKQVLRRLQHFQRTGQYDEFRKLLRRIKSTPGEKPPIVHLLDARVLMEVGLFDEAGAALAEYYQLASPSDDQYATAKRMEELLNKAGVALPGPSSTQASRQSEQIVFMEDEEDLLPSEREIAAGRYFALLIGIEDYTSDTLVDLRQPIDDAEALQKILTMHYTFEPDDVTVLRNPSREELITELDRLARVVRPQDNLLIFYAGHGFWDEQFQQGYWLPSDATRDSRSGWIANGTVRDYIRGIPSRHTLLVSDACFSGGIFKTRSAFAGAGSAIRTLYQMPSRKAMTSGTMTEVPDRSVFMRYLKDRLQDNSETYLAAEQLFSSFRTAVINNSPLEQVPQFGEIREAGDEGGDFIFVRRVDG